MTVVPAGVRGPARRPVRRRPHRGCPARTSSGSSRTAGSPSTARREGEHHPVRRARPASSRSRSPSPLLLEPEDIPLDVVYEDDDILIVDKPSGLVVHPAPGHADGTLVNALLARGDDGTAGSPASQRPGIVHRLDRDTCGAAHGREGRPRAGEPHGPAQGAPGEEDVPRARRRVRSRRRSAGSRRPSGATRGTAMRQAVRPDGRPSTTGYRVRERFAGLDARSRSTSSPAGPTRSASTSRRSATRWRATSSTARAPPARARTGWAGSSCTPGGWSCSRPRTGT